MGGQTPPPTQTTTQTITPQQQELMDLALPGVRSFAASVPQPYKGLRTAGFDPLQTQGQEMALQAAGNQGSLAGAGKNTSDFYLGGDIWNPATNPNLQGAVDAAVRPIQENLTESTLPAIRGGSILTGGLGGSRQGIAEVGASREASRAIGDTASKLVQNQYETNVNAQLKALGLLPQTIQSQLAGALTTSGVGDVRQAQTQAQLNDQANQFNFEQYAPFLQSKEILSLLQGLPGGGSVSTGSVPPINPASQALGGAAAGATLGSALFPGVGTAAGAGIGSVLPFLFR